MRTIANLILLIVLILVIPFHELSCASIKPIPVPVLVNEPTIEVIKEEPRAKVVLITLDGVRWQEIFNGTDPFLYRNKKISARQLLPNMYHYFVDNGMVVGKDSIFVATGPHHISLPGYLEIMTGHPSTSCQENNCEPSFQEDTMLDLFNNPAVFASWDTIRKTLGRNSNKFVVNCGRHFRSSKWNQAGLEDNQIFPEAFSSLYRTDYFTEKAVVQYLQYNNPDFIWVSLGDTDEWAHYGNYDKYIESLQQADQFIGRIMQMMQSKENGNDFAFIITADHGRGLDWHHHGWDNESARDWLMMTGYKIPKQSFVKFSEKKSLSNILPTVKELTTGVRIEDSLLLQ